MSVNIDNKSILFKNGPLAGKTLHSLWLRERLSDEKNFNISGIDNIDKMFNLVSYFINYYNIELTVDTDVLYNYFVAFAFKTSHIPFTQMNYSFYRVNKTYHNDYYFSFLFQF